jgi:hypothetical protein
MFDIEVCEARRIVLVRFHGHLEEADFTALDVLASSARGDGKAFDCIYDMTSVVSVGLAPEFAAKRGELPQAYKDHKRIYVVPNDDLKLLIRLYATYQANKGWKAPIIVRELDDALAHLNASRSDFRPLQINPKEAQ